MFEQVNLRTKEGEFVTTVNIPRFTIPADVLIWGTRLFIRQLNGEYREGMAYYVVLN